MRTSRATPTPGGRSKAATRDATDYWPDDRAALIGEIDGGDGATRDSGLAVDYDRVVLRVLGGSP
jgi:hypothetical protein